MKNLLDLNRKEIVLVSGGEVIDYRGIFRTTFVFSILASSVGLAAYLGQDELVIIFGVLAACYMSYAAG